MGKGSSPLRSGADVGRSFYAIGMNLPVRNEQGAINAPDGERLQNKAIFIMVL